MKKMLPKCIIQPYSSNISDQTRLLIQISNELDSNTYNLRFDNSGFTLISGSESAEFCGIVSLIQIIQSSDGSSPSFDIVDYPDFNWRGIHLDVSRHFFQTDEIKRVLDLMALYKLNKFHWHLTDCLLYTSDAADE